MESQRSLCLLWVLSACCFFSSCEAYTFYVGGRDGWVLNPHESYNQWAGRNRFQVNDTIVFENKNGSDSVLRVDKEDYSNCSTKKPLEIMKSGSAVFKFNQSGPFYFISGDEDHCKQGQKLTVVVLAVRPKQSPPETPSPGHLPPAPPSGAGSPSQTPAASPNHPSPSPQSHAQPPPAAAPKYPSTPANSPGVSPPAQAPVPSHGANTPHPAKAPSSPTLPPEHATSPSLPSSPNYTPFPPALSPKAPSSAPSSKSPGTSPSSMPVPSAPSPASTPTSPSTPAADTPNSSPGSQTPPGSGSQNIDTPAPSASWVVTPWNVMWILGSILFSSIIVGVYT